MVVSLIARVAAWFVTSSSLEVVTRLTTNGERDVLRYHVCGLGGAPDGGMCVDCIHLCSVFVRCINLLSADCVWCD